MSKVVFARLNPYLCQDLQSASVMSVTKKALSAGSLRLPLQVGSGGDGGEKKEVWRWEKGKVACASSDVGTFQEVLCGQERGDEKRGGWKNAYDVGPCTDSLGRGQTSQENERSTSYDT